MSQKQRKTETQRARVCLKASERFKRASESIVWLAYRRKWISRDVSSEFETVFTLRHLLILQKVSWITLLRSVRGSGKSPVSWVETPKICTVAEKMNQQISLLKDCWPALNHLNPTIKLKSTQIASSSRHLRKANVKYLLDENESATSFKQFSSAIC